MQLFKCAVYISEWMMFVSKAIVRLINWRIGGNRYDILLQRKVLMIDIYIDSRIEKYTLFTAMLPAHACRYMVQVIDYEMIYF